MSNGTYQVYKVVKNGQVEVIHNYNLKKCLNCNEPLRSAINFKNKSSFCRECNEKLPQAKRDEMHEAHFKHMREMQDAKYDRNRQSGKKIYNSPFRA